MTHEDQLLGRITMALQSRHATDSVRITTNNNTLTMGTDVAGVSTALRTYLFLERAMVELDGINPKVADAIRDRMDTIWHELTESDRARLDDRTEGLWSACAETGLGHDRTTVSWHENELDALTSLAIAVGLDADGSDPRDASERLSAERDVYEPAQPWLCGVCHKMHTPDLFWCDVCNETHSPYECACEPVSGNARSEASEDSTTNADESDRIDDDSAVIERLAAERDAAVADAEALRLAARAYFTTIDNAPPFGAGDLALREHDAACDKTAHTLAVLAGARGPR